MSTSTRRIRKLCITSELLPLHRKRISQSTDAEPADAVYDPLAAGNCERFEVVKYECAIDRKSPRYLWPIRQRS